MGDTATGLVIALALVTPALAIPLSMELIYRRRERRDGKR